MRAISLSLKAFREAYVTSELEETATEYAKFDARRLRYDILWAMYENTAWRDVHTWATAYRKTYALYKYIRNIYSPGYRLGEFYKAHLFGGLLDPGAGDAGAIPIVTESEQLRFAIAELWKWSNWAVNKDILTLQGSVLGDIALAVVDDVQKGRVYLDILHPGALSEVDKDAWGNVKGYVFTEIRLDPKSDQRTVTYTEQVTRDGDLVVYETFLNNDAYAWPENTDRTGTPVATWSEPYGFVPLVLIQHNDVGLGWGWSELHPIRSKMQEVNDIASMVSDQIRKTVDPIWLMKGMKKTTLTMEGASDTASVHRPAPGREELQALWGVPIDGDAKAMIADLDFEPVLLHIQAILAEIERDYPELRTDLHTSSGDASGRALRVARQPVVSKVVQRRANYDAGLVSAQAMAIAIGGWRGYDGYAGFGLDSYAQGDLEHTIADRPVFADDPLDHAEVAAAEWDAAIKAVKAGVPLAGYLREIGWEEDRITQLLGGDDNVPIEVV